MPLLFLLCCWLALAPAMAQEQVDPAVQRALLQQDLLPALAARTQAAQARQAAAESWFAGDGAWREAFPGLSHAPLGDPGFLASTSWQIQQRARLRATELAAVPPDGLAGAQDDLVLTWRKQLAQACAAEEAADTLELRFLAGLQAALDLAPELADESVEPLYGMWAGLRTSADAEEPSPQALALAAAASQATQALEALRQQAWRAATVPGDPALIDAVREEARVVPDRWPADSGETLLLEARVDRLRRVAPLLSADLAEDVDDLARQFELLRLHAEKASLEDQLAEADQVASDDLPIAQLEQQVRALHVSLEAAREEAGTILIEGAQDGLHQEVAQLRVWLTEKRLAAREAGLVARLTWRGSRSKTRSSGLPRPRPPCACSWRTSVRRSPSGSRPRPPGARPRWSPSTP